MHYSAPRVLVAAVAVLLALAPHARAQQPQQDHPPRATLTVQTDKPGPAVPPSLYGIFFEEINRAGDGGLYAEMINNRSFEDADQPVGWDVTGDAKIDRAHPIADLNVRSMQISSGRIVNKGFKGMVVRGGTEYVASLFARGGLGTVTVKLESADGKVLASNEAEAVGGGEWKRYVFPIKASADAAAAQFAVEVKSNQPLWIDMVSLFPKQTWKDRGLRIDLAEKVADLQPNFVRFPGGCWVEGETVANAYRWKQTIGPIEKRRNQYNLWKYQSTHGLGYHEYLQWCEDLGADAMFVINCGMAHKDVVPMEQMGEWVQDALDAIEYANGPADSKWGAERAKNGHPEPFKLKYLEIGNENGGANYDQRYALFYDAIKAKYPEIQLIAGEWRGRPKSRPIEILDEHYYDTPAFFIANADRYDAYDRKGPKIYVGEYAITRGSGTGNLIAAVAEAAFMAGMERNSDVVVMSSYAPLFAHVGYKAWNPDAIMFDASRSYGTPSYYVQKMFSANRADVVLPVDVELPAMKPEPRRGAVGVGTWATQAEFKDLKLTAADGKVLLAADFASDVAPLRPGKGEWTAGGGAAKQSSNATGCFAVGGGDAQASDYTLSLKARKIAGREGFLIPFHWRDDKNYSMWNLGGWGNVRHGIQVTSAGATAEAISPKPGRIETDRWYDIRIETQGERVRCYLDDQLVHDVTYPQPKPIHVVAGRKGDHVILKVANVTAQPIDAIIKLAGAGASGASGKAAAIVLTGKSPDDENSLDEPTKVAPAETSVDVAGGTIGHAFPAYSVTVLRVPAPATAAAAK